MAEITRDGRNVRGDIVFVFVLALVCYVVWLVRDVLVLLYVSALFAVMFAPVVQSVSTVHVGRWRPFKGIAVLILPMVAVGVILAFGFFALPPVARDLQEFSKEMPARTPALLEKLDHIPFADHIDPGDLDSRIQGFASNAASYLLVSIKNWAGALFSIIMGFILTIYFILEGDHAYRWFLSFFPPPSRGRLDLTLQRAEVRMGKWLLGQGSLMLVLGLTSTIVYLSPYTVCVCAGGVDRVVECNSNHWRGRVHRTYAAGSRNRFLGPCDWRGDFLRHLPAGRRLISRSAHYEKQGGFAGVGHLSGPADWVCRGGRCGGVGLRAYGRAGGRIGERIPGEQERGVGFA